MSMSRWLDPRPARVPQSMAGLGLHPLVAQTLADRGLNTPAEVEAFLYPERCASTPFPNLEAAVERIQLAVKNQEKVCVWGDFDVDGQTSTALLVETLTALGANVRHYIPVRGRESHGVHIPSLTPILDSGVTLLITCDTGISAHPAIEYANSRGADVIVTDHHDPAETLPPALAILNPKLLEEGHPLENLAGVGVAYKLAEALLPDLTPSLLDLAALGLIADVAMLKGETRAIAKQGIVQLRQTDRLGLQMIAESASASLETLTEESIGFVFAPRLNALGRLSDANSAVEFLLTKDTVRARQLASQLEELNSQRRLLTSQVFEAAESQLRLAPERLTEPVLILSHPAWPGGVIGIVANKLVERYHKPAILFNTSEDGILRGSARSVEGLHITEAIAAQSHLLKSFGGHPMAAGLALDSANLEEFRRGIGRAVEEQLGAGVREQPSLQIDAWVDPAQIDMDLANALETLAPFGPGNPQLVLAMRDVVLKNSTVIGRTKEHRRLSVEDDRGNQQTILWWGGAGEDIPDLGSRIDLAFTIRANTYRGQRQFSLQLQDLRAADDSTPAVRSRAPKFTVEDLRLQTFHAGMEQGAMVWAEGKESALGRSRYDLERSDVLVILTVPPSPHELRQALESVSPKVVRIFSGGAVEEKPEEFLNRLAGLCKYALNHYQGQASLKKFSAALAARESAVQLGLEWLAAGGQLNLEWQEDAILLSAEKREKNPYLQSELFLALKGTLAESLAFRKFFITTSALPEMVKI